MIAYIIRRTLYAIPILIGVNLLTFVLFFVVNSPDDVARAHLGVKHVTQEAIDKWKVERGYDKPLMINESAAGVKKITDTLFFEKSLALFAFEFGRADDGRSIGHEISTRMWPSLAIAVPTLIIGIGVAISFALLLAFFRGSYIDLWGVVLCVIMMSISSLFYIIGGQYLVGKLWHLVPISGYDIGLHGFKFIVLPVVIGVIGGMGAGIRLYRILFLEEMGKEYVRTARAKGLSEPRVLFIHVLKKRHDPHPHRRGGDSAHAVSGQPDPGILFRHPRPRQLHHRCDSGAGLRRRARHGVSGFGALYHRSFAHRYFLHPS